MDTDDIAVSNRFQRQVSFMEAHLEIHCCLAWIEEFIESVDKIVSVKNYLKHTKRYI